MKIYTEAAILKAERYSDIFSSNITEAKRQFRHYCKSYHPDADNSAKAARIFEKLMSLYGKTPVSCSREKQKNTAIFLSKDTNKGFELSNPVIFDAGTCIVYHTQTKIVLSYRKEFKKFYDRYMAAVKNTQYADSKMETQFSRLFPKIIKNFEEEHGNFIILLSKTPEVLNLSLVIEAYKKKGENFPERHAAWIMNRIYNIAAYMEFYKKAFNGFSPCNMWISPEFHTVSLLNGWEYIEGIGGKMAGCPKDVYKILPLKAKESHISCTLTDQESIRQVGRSLFSGSTCKNIMDFFNSGSEDKGIINEWQCYEKMLLKDLGKRTFVVWDDVPYI